MEKLQNYSTAKFMNEVLALPHDSATNPITESDLKAICTCGDNTLVANAELRNARIFFGVDWGHGEESVTAKRGDQPTGYTVLTIGRYAWDGRFELIGAKKFIGNESDPIFQVKEVTRLAKMFNAIVGVDFGGGFLHNRQLIEHLGPDRIIEWQANESVRSMWKWIPEAGRMIFNRTECMTERFVEIKNQKVKFFKWEDFELFSPDFLTIYVDYRTNGGTMFYNHVLPDDAFHSYMMCKMTADYMLRSGE